MPERTSAKSASKPSTKTRATRSSANIWTEEERAAMQASARERKAASRRDPGDARAEGERDVLEKIAEMPEPDRVMAERLHALVTSIAPSLVPRTYYGMPAYSKDGKVICFFQAASKFKVRYATFGFQPDAGLDDGAMWPIAFALTKLTAADEARIAELVKIAAG
jgi:uncharacterized protein YdhG (YjbR/CyaY superfamily)